MRSLVYLGWILELRVRRRDRYLDFDSRQDLTYSETGDLAPIEDERNLLSLEVHPRLGEIGGRAGRLCHRIGEDLEPTAIQVDNPVDRHIRGGIDHRFLMAVKWVARLCYLDHHGCICWCPPTIFIVASLSSQHGRVRFGFAVPFLECYGITHRHEVTTRQETA